MPRAARLRGLAIGLTLVGPLTADVPAAGSPREGLRVSVPSSGGTAVRRALLSARRRLGDSRCRVVFAEFDSTAHGQPLREVLRLRGRTPEEHLDSLVWKDGSGRSRCASPAILAFTHVGSDTVFVCASQFGRAAAHDPALAEIVLIHELLHTLGLGENPPSSREITARVVDRCAPGDSPTVRPLAVAMADDATLARGPVAQGGPHPAAAVR